jgi:macrodomain Ter protein organizer (MatP/YcbG family)
MASQAIEAARDRFAAAEKAYRARKSVENMLAWGAAQAELTRQLKAVAVTKQELAIVALLERVRDENAEILASLETVSP